MVTAKTQYNLKNAQRYFEEHLSVDDYYDQGQRTTGQWFGDGAERLGLKGQVESKEFLALCENHHPDTGQCLTQRLKSLRREDGKSVPNRRIFYDFTFSPPKSVSLVGLMGQDERVVEAHHRAVGVALGELERFAATRVRRQGVHDSRLTGNLLAALFTHDTSRALDPHLHTHCIVLNATFDLKEERWQQVIELEALGLRAQTTVADFLTRRPKLQGGVVVVDEAGQIGGRQMLELVRLVAASKGRLVLSGDTRQHGPVEASDALLALERQAGLKPGRAGEDPAPGSQPGCFTAGAGGH